MTDEEVEKHPDYIAMKERYQKAYARVFGAIFLISLLAMFLLPFILK